MSSNQSTEICYIKYDSKVSECLGMLVFFRTLHKKNPELLPSLGSFFCKWDFPGICNRMGENLGAYGACSQNRVSTDPTIQLSLAESLYMWRFFQ